MHILVTFDYAEELQKCYLIWDQNPACWSEITSSTFWAVLAEASMNKSPFSFANCSPSSVLTALRWDISHLFPMSMIAKLGLACFLASSNQLAKWLNVSLLVKKTQKCKIYFHFAQRVHTKGSGRVDALLIYLREEVQESTAQGAGAIRYMHAQLLKIKVGETECSKQKTFQNLGNTTTKEWYWSRRIIITLYIMSKL